MRRKRANKPRGTDFITNKVIVEHDNFGLAFKKFKRLTKKSNIKQECRERMQYTKPSEKRKIAKQKARKIEARRQGHF